MVWSYLEIQSILLVMLLICSRTLKIRTLKIRTLKIRNLRTLIRILILLVLVFLIVKNYAQLMLLCVFFLWNNMCDHKIRIKNPLKGSGQIGLNFLKDTTSTFIEVPCGHCSQCASMRQSFFLQRVQMESLRSHLFFFTLTYNDESLIYTDVGEYHIAYPVISDVQNMFKRLRKRGFKFRVTYVSEYGSIRHRPHFHGILAVDKQEGDFRTIEKMYFKAMSSEWRRNYGDPLTPRVPKYRSLYTPVYKHQRLTTFDLHYIEPVFNHDNDVSFYVSKYITKYDSWISKLMQKISLDTSLTDEQTSHLLDLLRPRCNTSKDFGDKNDPVISHYIRQCSARETDFKYPQFFDIYTKKQMPMSPYYAKDIPDFAHLYKLYERSPLADENSTVSVDKRTLLEISVDYDTIRLRDLEFARKLKKLEKRLCQ